MENSPKVNGRLFPAAVSVKIKPMLRLCAALVVFLVTPAAAAADDWAALARAAYARTVTQPENPELLNSYGYFAYRANLTAAAETAYRRSLALRPGFAVGWNNLGVLYLKLGRYPDAERCFRRAVALDAKYSKARYNLAVTRFRQGAYFEAMALFYDVRKKDKLYSDLRSNPDQAERALDEAIKAEPLNPVLRAAKLRYERYKQDKTDDGFHF